MKKHQRRLLLLAAVSLLTGCADGCRVNVVNTNGGGTDSRQVTGGPCQYHEYPGTLTVGEVHAPPGGGEVVTVEFDADSAGAAPQPRPALLPRSDALARAGCEDRRSRG